MTVADMLRRFSSRRLALFVHADFQPAADTLRLCEALQSSNSSELPREFEELMSAIGSHMGIGVHVHANKNAIVQATVPTLTASLVWIVALPKLLSTAQIPATFILDGVNFPLPALVDLLTSRWIKRVEVQHPSHPTIAAACKPHGHIPYRLYNELEPHVSEQDQEVLRILQPALVSVKCQIHQQQLMVELLQAIDVPFTLKLDRIISPVTLGAHASQSLPVDVTPVVNRLTKLLTSVPVHIRFGRVAVLQFDHVYAAVYSQLGEHVTIGELTLTRLKDTYPSFSAITDATTREKFQLLLATAIVATLPLELFTVLQVNAPLLERLVIHDEPGRRVTQDTPLHLQSARASCPQLCVLQYAPQSIARELGYASSLALKLPRLVHANHFFTMERRAMQRVIYLVYALQQLELELPDMVGPYILRSMVLLGGYNQVMHVEDYLAQMERC
jgi:hypothetical protein